MRLLKGKRSDIAVLSEDEKYSSIKANSDATTTSFLVKDSKTIERERRNLEQQFERKLFAKVNAKEHSPEEHASTGNELEHSVKDHPFFKNSARFSGIPDGLTPEPPLNSEGRKEFDNQEREKQLQHNLQHSLKYSNSNTPKPRPQ